MTVQRLAVWIALIAFNTLWMLQPAVFAAQPQDLQPAPFNFTWSGAPSAPQPWRPADWDVIVHSRDTSAWDQLDSMQAQHGPDCSPPPATHLISSYDDAVFICRNHMMTAINAGGYGVIYFSPNRLVDFSNGPASITYVVSTQRSSPRDWQDIWITPFDDNLVLPLYRFPDLQGPPRNAVHFQLVSDNTFNGSVFRNFENTDLPKRDGTPYDNRFSPSATQRSTFELDISRTHLTFGMPAYGLWWVDTEMPDLGFDRAVVQIGHHSYNPTKAPNGVPGTWHWGSFSISSAVPFTMVRGDLQSVNANTRDEVCFTSGAPTGSFLRFAGVGSVRVSFDRGRTFEAAKPAAQVGPRGDGILEPQLFASYWTPVPAGTTSVVFRGTDWWGGPWWVRDPAIWSLSTDMTQAPAASSCPSHIPAAGQLKAGTPETAGDLAWLTGLMQRLHALDHELDGRIGRRNVELLEVSLAGLAVLLALAAGFSVGRRRRPRRRGRLARQQRP